MDFIDKHLATGSTDPKYLPSIQASMLIGKQLLNKYYNMTDNSEVYRIAMGKKPFHFLNFLRLKPPLLVLDPRCKLDYFRTAGWEEEWIETAQEIVREEFDRNYAGLYLKTDKKKSSPVRKPVITLRAPVGSNGDPCQASIKNSANLFEDLLSCSSSAPANPELRTELTQYLSTGPEDVKDPLLWWVGMQAVYPHLSRMAHNYLTIPGMFLLINII